MRADAQEYDVPYLSNFTYKVLTVYTSYAFDLG